MKNFKTVLALIVLTVSSSFANAGNICEEAKLPTDEKKISTFAKLSESQGFLLSFFLMVDLGKGRGSIIDNPQELNKMIKDCRDLQQRVNLAYDSFRDHVIDSVTNADCMSNLDKYNKLHAHNAFTYTVSELKKWAQLSDEEEDALTYSGITLEQFEKLYRDTKSTCNLLD